MPLIDPNMMPPGSSSGRPVSRNFSVDMPITLKYDNPSRLKEAMGFYLSLPEITPAQRRQKVLTDALRLMLYHYQMKEEGKKMLVTVSEISMFSPDPLMKRVTVSESLAYCATRYAKVTEKQHLVSKLPPVTVEFPALDRSSGILWDRYVKRRFHRAPQDVMREALAGLTMLLGGSKGSIGIGVVDVSSERELEDCVRFVTVLRELGIPNGPV